MAKSIKKTLKEEYDKLKKSWDNLINSKNQEKTAQLILQPIKTKKYLRGTDLP